MFKKMAPPLIEFFQRGARVGGQNIFRANLPNTDLSPPPPGKILYPRPCMIEGDLQNNNAR